MATQTNTADQATIMSVCGGAGMGLGVREMTISKGWNMIAHAYIVGLRAVLYATAPSSTLPGTRP